MKGKSCTLKGFNAGSSHLWEAHPWLSITQDIIDLSAALKCVRMAARDERAEPATSLPRAGQQHLLKAK